jgi:hypothetical protein
LTKVANVLESCLYKLADFFSVNDFYSEFVIIETYELCIEHCVVQRFGGEYFLYVEVVVGFVVSRCGFPDVEGLLGERFLTYSFNFGNSY